jgi:hypothetical protein
MNEQAEAIYQRVKAEAAAKGKTSGGETTRVKWSRLWCYYYPMSRRFSWFGPSTNVTESLTKRQVISLINIELEEGAE